MANRKKIAQELKRPDQFVDFWTRASQRLSQFVGPRRKPVIAAAVALGVVLVGASIFNVWDQSHRIEVSHGLSRALQIANADLLSDATKPDDAGSKTDVPRFKTAGERSAAVLKELDAFLAVGASRGLKNEARLMKGATLLGMGRSDDAMTSYQEALNDKLDGRLRFLAHEGIGYAYESKGDLDQAMKAFGQIADDAAGFQGFYRDHALYHRARLTAAKGDKAGAVALYRQILEKAPEPSMKSEVTDRLAVLEAK